MFACSLICLGSFVGLFFVEYLCFPFVSCFLCKIIDWKWGKMYDSLFCVCKIFYVPCNFCFGCVALKSFLSIFNTFVSFIFYFFFLLSCVHVVLNEKCVFFLVFLMYCRKNVWLNAGGNSKLKVYKELIVLNCLGPRDCFICVRISKLLPNTQKEIGWRLFLLKPRKLCNFWVFWRKLKDVFSMFGCWICCCFCLCLCFMFVLVLGLCLFHVLLFCVFC